MISDSFKLLALRYLHNLFFSRCAEQTHKIRFYDHHKKEDHKIVAKCKSRLDYYFTNILLNELLMTRVFDF